MDLILVILIFIILICVIKTREFFYNDPTNWKGHGHKHENDHHTPTHTHKILPIADPTFKYEERQMICELLPHKTQCEHYGCEWDSTDICRNPIKGNEKICNHVNNGTYTESQQQVICGALDNCTWDTSDTSDKGCKFYPYCSSVNTINDITKRKAICKKKDTKCKLDNDKCIDKDDPDDLCDTFKNTKKCRERTKCYLEKTKKDIDGCTQCIKNTESDPKKVINVWDINNSQCFTSNSSKDLNDLQKILKDKGAPDFNKQNYVLGAIIGGKWGKGDTEIIKCDQMPARKFNNDKPTGCDPNCDLIKPLPALKVQNYMCVPQIQTCSDLTNEDTCESYPNIRYCRWDHPNCVDRIKNTNQSFTLPTFT